MSKELSKMKTIMAALALALVLPTVSLHAADARLFEGVDPG